jgi:hypothetical protein
MWQWDVTNNLVELEGLTLIYWAQYRDKCRTFYEHDNSSAPPTDTEDEAQNGVFKDPVRTAQ